MESKPRPSRRAPRRATGPDALVEAASAALPADLPSRRWFGDKARTIGRVTPIDHAAVLGTTGALALFRVEFTEGEPETYCVPMMPPTDGVARGSLADALDDPAFCTALVEQIRQG